MFLFDVGVFELIDLPHACLKSFGCVWNAVKLLIVAAPLWGAILNSAASLWFDVCVVEHSGLPSVFFNFRIGSLCLQV